MFDEIVPGVGPIGTERAPAGLRVGAVGIS
jgi:hypothetical protein